MGSRAASTPSLRFSQTPAKFPPTLSRGNSNFSSSRPDSPVVSSFVTGPPSRVHWRPDEDVTECQAVGCDVVFGLVKRRHHCRRCGNIFCADHSMKQARLDQNSNFNLRGVPCRVCDKCSADFDKLLVPLKKPDFGEQTEESQDEGSDVPIPPEALKGTISGAVAIDQKTAEAMAPLMSVPNDWQWSTF